MTVVRLAVLLSTCAFFHVFKHTEGIEILVYVHRSVSRVYYTDAYDNIPELGVNGYLVYPSLLRQDEECRGFRPINDSTYGYIALIEDYDNCTSQIGLQTALLNAGFTGVIGLSDNYRGFQSDTGGIAIALVKHGDFGNYLKRYAGVNSTYVTLQGDILSYQHYFLIFSALLLSAIVLSVIVFCCTMCCRLGVHRWVNRRVSLWSVRRLPKRKYHSDKETCDTCSICLEAFKENESLRVLPCEHVYHPRCIDEWLHKWNRVCPLCKASISENRRSHQRPNVQTESASLLINGDATVENGRNYGTANGQVPAAAPTGGEGAQATPPSHGGVVHATDQDSSVPVPAEKVDGNNATVMA